MTHQDFMTHEVTNQSPPFGDINLFTSDVALQEAVIREGGEPARDRLSAFGASAGSAEGFEIGRLANENPPKLRRFDEKGFPSDRIEFHPAYHQAMALSIGEGLHCSIWDHLPTSAHAIPGVFVGRLAGIYMMTQMEAGHVCPVTMTNAAVAALMRQPDLLHDLLPKILSRRYDPAFVHVSEKSGMTIGMGMTEKQGGSDVRVNATTAARIEADRYNIVGHKWFLSAPMCDAFLMLAQAPGGLSCFYVPRIRDDGRVNALRLQRLKDKLGNRSNASSEVELTGAEGRLIGEEGRGIATIIEMVTLTRLDCAVASAGQMRLALANAIHHCRHRRAFQKHLIDQPVMIQVLADMALDVEAATALAFRLARAFDRAQDEGERAWQRLMTPVAKYWICKMAPALGYEAMECLGGNGYVEEGLAARLYRELPLNAIWEGSGNIMALDVQRVLTQSPEAFDLVIGDITDLAGTDRAISAAVGELKALAKTALADATALRVFVERLALIAAASLVHAHAPPIVSDAFVATRLSGGFRHTYGAAGAVGDARAIVERALPAA